MYLNFHVQTMTFKVGKWEPMRSYSHLAFSIFWCVFCECKCKCAAFCKKRGTPSICNGLYRIFGWTRFCDKFHYNVVKTAGSTMQCICKKISEMWAGWIVAIDNCHKFNFLCILFMMPSAIFIQIINLQTKCHWLSIDYVSIDTSAIRMHLIMYVHVRWLLIICENRFH